MASLTHLLPLMYFIYEHQWEIRFPLLHITCIPSMTSMVVGTSRYGGLEETNKGSFTDPPFWVRHFPWPLWSALFHAELIKMTTPESQMPLFAIEKVMSYNWLHLQVIFRRGVIFFPSQWFCFWIFWEKKSRHVGVTSFKLHWVKTVV